MSSFGDSKAEPFRGIVSVTDRETLAWPGRLLMLGLNFLPFFHVLVILGVAIVPFTSFAQRLVLALGLLYLAPPLLARLFLVCLPLRQSRIVLGTRDFFVWWALFQLQVIFCRLPALEEFLRFVPGLYSLWLRLWGSRIGRFTYWAAGTLITDRSFLVIGNFVVFGAGVRLNSHVLARDKEGRLQLLLAAILVGDRSIIGGYSLLTAGTEIASDEVTRAFLVSPPFSTWKEGKRVRGEKDHE